MDVNIFAKVLSPHSLGPCLLVKIKKNRPSIMPRDQIDFIVVVFIEAAEIYDIRRLANSVHVNMCEN